MRKVKRTTGLWITDGGFYYTRKWENGSSKWVRLGPDIERARETLTDIKNGKRRVFRRVPVEKAVADWLPLSIATSPNAKAQKIPPRRCKQNLLQFKDPKTVESMPCKLRSNIQPLS